MFTVLWNGNELFRIQLRIFLFRIQPILFKQIWGGKILNILNSIKKKNLPYQLSDIFNFILQYNKQSRIHSPKLEMKFLFICSFIFSWIRIQKNI